MWRNNAIARIKADERRSGDTNLLRVWFPKVPEIDLYLKDESNHKTGSLKHRLARSLYTFAIVNGLIDQNTVVFEASSGNTAISEAYFAQLLDLKFVAVMARSTSRAKIKRVEKLGGICHLVENSGEDRATAGALAEDEGGHFMDQFTYAERATDWKASNNVAESTLKQMELEPHPIPRWYVCSAGTGGTSATIGRHLTYQSLPTQLCVVDPENSVYYDFYKQRDRSLTSNFSSRIEGIGRRSVESSFIPTVISRMMRVPDAASIAAIRFLADLTGIHAGGSTGTNLYGAIKLIVEMKDAHETGSIVSLICDSGQIYADTYYNDEWLKRMEIDIKPYLKQLKHYYKTGDWIDVK